MLRWVKKQYIDVKDITEIFKIIDHAEFHIRLTRIVVIIHLAAVSKSSKRLIQRHLKKIEKWSLSHLMTINFQSTEQTLFLCSFQGENE